MSNSFLLTPDSVIYRQVGEELVVIHLDTGKMYYFNPQTENVLEFFRQPRKLDTFLDSVDLHDSKKVEVEHIKSFARFLLENRLLEEQERGESTFSDAEKHDYARPEFLRLDPKTLDEIAFLCP